MKLWLGLWSAFLGVAAGCAPADPMGDFIRRMDSMPPERQLPNWGRTKFLMSRQAPTIGAAAPDFTLSSPDGSKTFTRSDYQNGRPLVLVFGSFT